MKWRAGMAYIIRHLMVEERISKLDIRRGVGCSADHVIIQFCSVLNIVVVSETSTAEAQSIPSSAHCRRY